MILGVYIKWKLRRKQKKLSYRACAEMTTAIMNVYKKMKKKENRKKYDCYIERMPL